MLRQWQKNWIQISLEAGKKVLIASPKGSILAKQDSSNYVSVEFLKAELFGERVDAIWFDDYV